MSSKKLTAITAVVLLLLLIGCGSSQSPPSSSPPQQQVSIFESSKPPKQPAVDPEIEKEKQKEEKKAEEPQETYGTEFIPEDTGIEFTTPYIKLRYPEELQGKVELTHSTEGKKHTVAFKTPDGETTLFSLIFSPDAGEPGYKMGTLNDPTAGAINVFTDISDLPKEQLSDQQYSDLCAMQERVNDLIAQLHEDPRFSPQK